MELIHLLSSKPEFSYRHSAVFGEAKMMHFIITNANAICNFIPIVVSIKAVATLWLELIIQLAFATGEVESVTIMNQMATANLVDRFEIYLHSNIHIGFGAVCTVFNFRPHLFTLPTIPIGNMGDEFEPAMVAGHSLGELSALTAAGALTFEDGLVLVYKRAMAMQKACELQESTMAAIIGLEDKIVENLLKN